MARGAHARRLLAAYRSVKEPQAQPHSLTAIEVADLPTATPDPLATDVVLLAFSRGTPDPLATDVVLLARTRYVGVNQGHERSAT